MSRPHRPPRPADAPRRRSAEPYDTARIAEEIGIEALAMAKSAHAAGLSTIGYLLENVALAAGTESLARQWPADASER
ncbi:MAG TPA: hypothetical protein VEF90_00315 [Xanthobacteraceae bacterium]|nr:hypothetical protein [Xanthobacteraceae bacterium]